MLVVGGDLSAHTIARINKNFDAPHKESVDDYDVLLTTDRISEGFNLNRAGLVINYDIPWNPVRVIQRVGRINRISKKCLMNFFWLISFPQKKARSLSNHARLPAIKCF